MAAAKKGSWVRKAALFMIVGAVGLTFVLFFGLPQGRTPISMVAEIDGERITENVANYYLVSNQERWREMLPDEMDPAQVNQQLRAAALNLVLSRAIQRQEAEALGLRVGDKELVSSLTQHPGLQIDGRFDREGFERIWRRSGLPSERMYLDETWRSDLLIQKLVRTITSPVRISDAEVREALLRDRLRVRLNYAQSEVGDFLETVHVSTFDARTLAQEQPDRVQAAYQARISEFQRPEELHARHILFTGEDALARAQAARERLVSGEDFTALARELSEDEATRQEGGDLGFFPRGRMLAAFEDAAFALETGKASEPVETEHGVHLILVEGRRAGLDRSLEDASEELASEILRRDLAAAAAREAAEKLLKELQSKPGGDFAELAARAGLESADTPSFGPADPQVPGLPALPGLQALALSLKPEAPHAGRVFDAGDRFYVVSLLERDEPDEATLQAELEPLRDRLELQTRDRLLQRWIGARREHLEQTGKLVVHGFGN